eukprot:686063-Rhodomonas_salina.1
MAGASIRTSALQVTVSTLFRRLPAYVHLRYLPTLLLLREAAYLPTFSGPEERVGQDHVSDDLQWTVRRP